MGTETAKELNSVKIRQALYEGIAREYLAGAWQQLNIHRKNLEFERSFRGTLRTVKRKPFSMMANDLDRGEGEVARWFRDVANWQFLTLSMFDLNAHWRDLRTSPEKLASIHAGWIHAMLVVRCHQEGRRWSDTRPATRHDLETLRLLHSDKQWRWERRGANRGHVLQSISARTGIPTEELDHVDLLWWGAWFTCVTNIKHWLETLNEIDPRTD